MADYELYERDEPALSGVERSLYDAVSANEPWSLVERFAELERVSGSEDEGRAAEEITDRLDRFGVDHVRHDPELYLSIPERATLSAAGESFDAVKTVAFGGGQATGEVVAVGDAPGDTEGVDELLSANLGDLSGIEGKIALLGGILPIEAVEELEAAGAAGVIVHHPHEREPHEGIATPVWGGAPTPRSDTRPPEIPIVTVADPVGSRLRELDRPTAELTAETTTGWFDCPLVHARITPDDASAGTTADGEETGDATSDTSDGGPSDTTLSEAAAASDEEFVLLHGHYDSWHVGVADNATGDAALLELARVFEEHSASLDRELWICWWPGHSTGRYAGSTWFADRHAGSIRDRCVAQVNVDSPGATDATEFEDMVVWMAEADELCRGAIRDVCGKEATENRPPRAGDYSFDNLGVTGAFMLSSNIPREVRAARGYHTVGGCGGHSDAWHLTTDTLDKADPDVLVRDVRVYAVALARLLRADRLPLDHRRTITAHRETLADYDAASDFDLGSVRAAAEAAEAAIDRFYAASEAGEIDPETANATIRALSRALVRVNFTTEGAFDHDPAYDRPPYPGLEPVTELAAMADDEARFQTVELRRQRNRAVALLNDAERAAARPLDDS